MLKKIGKAIENSLEGSIYAYYTLSDLSPPIGPNFICGANNDHTNPKFTFECIWWEDDSGHSGFDPKVAEDTKNQMIEEMKAQLASRNVIANLTGEVVQEFTWNNHYYDLDNHGISYAVYLKGEIQAVIGTILKNADDFAGEFFDRVTDNLITNLSQYYSPISYERAHN
jgi:hypothetical protein